MSNVEEIRAAREATSIFRGLFDYLRDQDRQLASEGRRPVLGGLLSKEPVMGTDTIRYEGLLPMLASLAEPLARGIDAPRAAAQELIPAEDMMGEAFGTAGTAMFGGGAVPRPVNSVGMGGRVDKTSSFDSAPLIAHHNINTEGLRVAQDIGGIPMPSIAISNANYPVQSFGDISLLLRPDQIDPKKGVNVFPADGYTGRQPKGFIDFVDENAARSALRSDPDFGHFGSDWLNSTDDFSDASRLMKEAQYGRDKGIGNPKDYNEIRDYTGFVKRELLKYDEGDGSYSVAVDEISRNPGLTAYGDTQMMMYPKDPYTPSGRRRDPQPYTLDEAFKRMRQNKAYKAGSESFSGPGLLRAVSSKQFKSVDEIKKSRGLLQPDDNDLADVKGSWDSFSYNKIDDLAKEHFDGRHRLAEDYVTDLAMGKSVSWASNDAGPNARAAALKTIAALQKEAEGMPTEYFEAKPKNITNISDFETAVVPAGADEAINILREQGVKNIKEYNDNDERAALMRQQQDFLFSNANASTGALVLGMQARAEPGLLKILTDRGVDPDNADRAPFSIIQEALDAASRQDVIDPRSANAILSHFAPNPELSDFYANSSGIGGLLSMQLDTEKEMQEYLQSRGLLQ